MRFLINKSKENLFSYRFVNDSSETVFSSPAFDSLDNCLGAIRQIIPTAANQTNYRTSGNSFSINENDQVLANGTSENVQALISSLANTVFQNDDFEVVFEENQTTQVGFASKLDTYDFTYASSSKMYGVETFLNSNNNKYFYHLNDASGSVLVFSQAYSSGSSRDSGVRSVLNNIDKSERVEYVQDGASYYFIVKSQNNVEIARSKNFSSQKDAESAVLYIKNYTNEFLEKYKKAEKKFEKSNNGANQYQLEKVSESGEIGFESYKNMDTKFHYFHLNNIDAKALLYSQGYTSAKAKDNGILSTIKSLAFPDRIVRKSENGAYFFVVKAGNKQEVARSRNFSSESEMENEITWIGENIEACAAAVGIDFASLETQSSKIQTFNIHIDRNVEINTTNTMAQDPQNDLRQEDDYLACYDYANRTEATEFAGIFKFSHSNGKHYFAWLDADGSVIMRSEGYPSESGRDNGMASVDKNRNLEERYAVKEQFGKYFAILKAGNHQEIAKSCAQDSEAAALGFYPAARAAAKAEHEAAALAAAAAKAEAERTAALAASAPVAAAAVSTDDAERANNREEDNYLACKEYEGHERDATNPEFAKFQHSNGEHYFVMYNPEGGVALRSEGYPSTAARDNGMASVMKNREIKERFSVKEMLNGYKFISLKAGNHQEIARSCPKKDEAELWGGYSWLWGSAAAVAGTAVVITEPVSAARVETIETATEVHTTELPLEEVIEEAPTVEAAEPVVEEKAPVVEIAAAAAAVASIAAVVETPKVETPAPVVEKVVHAAPVRQEEKEDDYMACEEYLGKTINDKANNVALFKHSNGQYYFVIYNADGSVKLRSEGFRNTKTRDEELSGVLRNQNNPDMYTNMEKGGYRIRILKDKTGREVGRSCLEKIGGEVSAAPVVAAAAAAAVVAAATQVQLPKVEIPAARVEVPAPPVVDIPAATGGFDWRWLLPLLLIPLLWFMCNKCKTTDVPTPAPKPAVVPPVKKVEPAKTKTAVKSFLPVTLYFDNDQPDARTKATTTAKTYAQAYDAYYPLRNDFSAKGDGKATVDFFETDVKKGMTDLEKLASALVEITKSGEKVKLNVSGFASPLAKGDYNQALTGRRVSSIKNYLTSYSNGALAKYITDGTIKLDLSTNSEDKSKGGVTDSAKDKKGSIYSVNASRERRVEITGIE
jgi:uncharacterized protein YegP (UPF0339 family)